MKKQEFILLRVERGIVHKAGLKNGLHDSIAVETVVSAAVKVKHTQNTLWGLEQVAVADVPLHCVAGGLPERGENRHIFFIFGADVSVQLQIAIDQARGDGGKVREREQVVAGKWVK